MKLDIKAIRPPDKVYDYSKMIYRVGILENVDMYNSEDLLILYGTIVAGGAKRVLFDVSELTYIDSSGIGALIRGTNSLRNNNNGNAAIININPEIEKVLNLVKFYTFIKKFDTEEHARYYLNAI